MSSKKSVEFAAMIVELAKAIVKADELWKKVKTDVKEIVEPLVNVTKI